MEKKERRIVFLIGIIALTFFTFTDLQNSQAVCKKQFPARVLEVIGEIPFMVLTLSGCAMLVRFRDKKNKWKGTANILGNGLLFMLFSSMGGFMTWNYLTKNIGEIPKLWIFIIGAVMAVSAIMIAKAVPQERSREAVSFAITALLYFLAVLIIMNLLKMTWGRMRFREMTDPLIEFTPWYQICGTGKFSDAYASFPSGHSMNSAAIILLILLPDFIPVLKGREKIIRVVVYVWIVLVAGSRVMMGAHFASDVTVGVLLSFILFELISKLFYRKTRRETI